MIVYGLTFAVSVMLSAWSDWRQRSPNGTLVLPRPFSMAAFSVFVVLAGVSALRWRVGTDYWAYDRNFEMYVAEFLDGPSFLEEPGIRMLAWVSQSFGFGSAGMFALAAVITVGLLVRTVWRWSPSFAMGIALLILSGVWHGSFNGVRQYIACAILFAGHRYIIDRKLFKWALVVLLASLFHISAIVCILLYIVPTKRTSIWIQVVVLSLGFIGMFGFEAVLGWIEAVTGDVGLSEGSYVTRSVNPLRVAFAFVPIALFWLLKNRRSVADSGAWFYVNMLVIYAAIYLASANSAYIARFAIYAAPFLSIALVSVTSVPNRVERILIRGSLLLIYGVFLYIDVSEVANLVNFQWIFNRE